MDKEILISPSSKNVDSTSRDRFLSVTKEQLSAIFKECWSKETSLDPDGWTVDVPSWFQCLPTALVIKKLFYSNIATQQLFVSGEEARTWRKKYHGSDPNDTGATQIRHYLNYIKTTEGNIVAKDFADGQFEKLGIEKLETPTPLSGDEEQNEIRRIYLACDFIHLGLTERENVLLEKVKFKLAEVLKDQLKKGGRQSLDHYLEDNKLLLDDSLPLQ